MASTSAPKFLLLFSMPRSGSSWIGKILDSHPLTLYKHEPDSGRLDLPLAPGLDQSAELRDPIQRFMGQLSTINNAHVAARLPVFPKAYRSTLAQRIHEASVLTAIALSPVHRRFPVLQCVNADRPDVHFIWKSIISLGRLGVIVRTVENCRAIRLIRHPCGYISSVLRGEAQQKFKSPVPTSEHYGTMRILLESAGKRSRGMTVDHMRQFHPIERMTWMWVLINEKAEEDTRGHERCLKLRYEDLCQSPESKSKELFSFFGLEWSEQTTAFIKASTKGVQPAAFDRMTQAERRYYSIFKDPIRAAEKWQSQMRAEDIDRVYNVLRQSDLKELYPQSEFSTLAQCG